MRLDCRQQADCHPSVAMISGVQPVNDSGWGTYQCTATLVDSQTILTNRHCIPHDLQKSLPGDGWTGRIWVGFPGGQEERREAVHLTARSARKDSTGQDWAFLRLDKPVGRPVLKLSRAGLPDGARLDAIGWDPILVQEGRGGRARRSTCRVVNGSPVTRFGTGDVLARSVLIEDCLVRVGNSGSPLLDSTGQVVGLVDGLFDPTQASLGALLSGVRLLDGEIRPMGQATNLACAWLPRMGGGASCPLPGKTVNPPYRNLAEVLDSLEKKASGISGLRSRTMLLDTSNSPWLYQLLIRRQGAPIPDLFAVVAPGCVRDAGKALSHWRNPWWKLWIGHQEEGTLELPVQAWPLQVGVDSHARLAVRRKEKPVRLEMRFAFRPAQFDRESLTGFAIDLRENLPGVPWIRVAQGNLGMCQE
ncbi:MAG: Trypsin-like peptidase domain [Fibrobacterota bacterium]